MHSEDSFFSAMHSSVSVVCLVLCDVVEAQAMYEFTWVEMRISQMFGFTAAAMFALLKL